MSLIFINDVNCDKISNNQRAISFLTSKYKYTWKIFILILPFLSFFYERCNFAELKYFKYYLYIILDIKYLYRSYIF